MSNFVTTRKGEAVQNPMIVNKLLDHKLAAWLWLPIRVWLGWQWMQAGLEKLKNPAWIQTGTALKGFWTNAVSIPTTGNPPIHYAWYRALLQMMLNASAFTWFAKLVSVGEFLIGVALILGFFTGLTAFIGGFLNWNYMMAGSASVNPMFLVLSVFLVMAWKISGYIGVDYFLVPWYGSLWSGKKDNNK
jgi:thiosulfate dehydrogenase [quinone] large subunit